MIERKNKINKINKPKELDARLFKFRHSKFLNEIAKDLKTKSKIYLTKIKYMYRGLVNINKLLFLVLKNLK